MAIFGFIVTSFVVLNDPISAIIGHLTFDPETGFFRVATWTFGLEQVALSPIVGWGLTSYTGTSDLVALYVGKSVDTLWLLLMIRFGVPVVVLLLLTIFIPFFKSNRISLAADPYLNSMRVGFSFAVIIMGLIGLTVHFWDAIWIFFSLCIGIRASFVELEARRSGIRAIQRPFTLAKTAVP